jgi:small nuclear ribonucleoprotein (snRNP)-like protein
MNDTNFFDDFIGQKVIIRATDSGVHYGTLRSVHDGTTIRLTDSRRLWEWKIDGPGVSLSEVAVQGVDHGGSKITAVLPDIVVMGVCEIIPTYGIAQATIEGAPVASGA